MQYYNLQYTIRIYKSVLSVVHLDCDFSCLGDNISTHFQQQTLIMLSEC